jgi:hypothetical protein
LLTLPGGEKGGALLGQSREEEDRVARREALNIQR